MQTNSEYILGKFLIFLSILFILGGIGLLIWCGVGQYIAQINYDGQYINIRTIQDISLWGYTGIPCLIIGIFLFIWGMNNI